MLRARGAQVGVVVAAFFLAGGGYLGFSEMHTEHLLMHEDHVRSVTEHQLATCVLSMTAEERLKLRDQVRRNTLRDALMPYCPWLEGGTP